MKRLLNISFLLTIFVLFGCHNKKAQENIWGIRPAPREVTRLTKHPLSDQGQQSVAASPLKSLTASAEPIVAAPGGTVPIQSNLVTVNESGPYIVSKTYPSADYGIIQVDKAMPREVRLKQAFDYSIKLTNLTDVTLNNVIVTEELPNGFELTGSSPSSQKEANKLVWKIESFQPKTTTNITVSGMGTSIENLENNTTVTYAAQVRANVKIVQPKLDLVVKAPAEVLLCDPITLEFVVTNSGSGSAPNARIIDTLPAGLQTVDGKSEIIHELGTLMAGQSQQYSVQLRATRTGMFVNKATVNSESGLIAESAAVVTTVCQPKLTIAMTGPAKQYLDRPLSYEITVTNRGNGLAKNTIIENSIPAGAASIEATEGANLTGTKLIWQLGTLEANASKRVKVSYVPTKAGTITNTASANAYCAETATASTQTLVAGIPAVRLDVIDLEDPIEVGRNTTYLITVTNQGTAADTNIRIACSLEDNVQYISSAGDTASSIMGSTVSFSPLHNLEPKAKATWRVVVKGVRPGDVHFKVTMSTDQLDRPVDDTEATHIYE